MRWSISDRPRPWRASAANQYTHAEQVLADGSYLVTLHPVGLPDVQVRVIEYRIEPHTAERLAQFPSSQTSNRSDPRQLHREVPTLLDPQQAPAVELILCYHERWEIEACIAEQKKRRCNSKVPSHMVNSWREQGSMLFLKRGVPCANPNNAERTPHRHDEAFSVQS